MDVVPLTLPSVPVREPAGHKGSYGRVLLVAGSGRYPGAAILSALGAGRGGAGLVVLGIPEPIVPTVVPAVPFAIVRACPPGAHGGLDADALPALLEEGARADVVVLGPGLGDDPATGSLVAALTSALTTPLVIDADGLNHLAAKGLQPLMERTASTVLLPHPGEFARLDGGPLPAGDGERKARAIALARRTGAVVVLKGHRSVVTDGGRAWIEPAGNPGMATGGMGDVLAGLTGALLAVVRPAAEATALAVHVHALAGDLAAQELGQEAVLPEDVALRLGRVLRGIRQEERVGS